MPTNSTAREILSLEGIPFAVARVLCSHIPKYIVSTGSHQPPKVSTVSIGEGKLQVPLGVVSGQVLGALTAVVIMSKPVGHPCIPHAIIKARKQAAEGLTAAMMTAVTVTMCTRVTTIDHLPSGLGSHSTSSTRSNISSLCKAPDGKRHWWPMS